MDINELNSRMDNYDTNEVDMDDRDKVPAFDPDATGNKHVAPPNVNDKPIDIDLVVTDDEAIIAQMNTGKTSKHRPTCPIIKLGNTYKAYVIGPIKDVHSYVNLMDLLVSATPEERVEIYLDSPGGYVSSGGIIASLIDSCKAEVYTIAQGICASAAALVHSSAKSDRISVSDFAVLMYHMSSHGDSGNSIGIAVRAANQVRYVEECLLKKALSDGHISEEDLALIKAGKDIFVSANEFRNGRDSNNPDIASHNESYGSMYIDEHDADKVDYDNPSEGMADDIDNYYGLNPEEVKDEGEPHMEHFHNTYQPSTVPMFYSKPAKMDLAAYMMRREMYSTPRLTVVNKNEFRIYMDAGQMFPPGYIAALCQFLDTRTSDDIVSFMLGTRMLDDQAHDIGAILSSIKSSAATIITRAEGYCSVTETMIWMCGKVRTVGRYGALSFNIMPMVDRCPAYKQYFHIFLDTARTQGIITDIEHQNIITSRSELMIMADRLIGSRKGYAKVIPTSETIDAVSKWLDDLGVSKHRENDAIKSWHVTLMYDKSNPDIEVPVVSDASYYAVPTTVEVMGDNRWRSLVLKIDSPTLADRHNTVKALGFTPSYPEYVPHMSLWLEPGDDNKTIDYLNEHIDRLKNYLPNGQLVFSNETWQVTSE